MRLLFSNALFRFVFLILLYIHIEQKYKLYSTKRLLTMGPKFHFFPVNLPVRINFRRSILAMSINISDLTLLFAHATWTYQGHIDQVRALGFIIRRKDPPNLYKIESAKESEKWCLNCSLENMVSFFKSKFILYTERVK